MSKKSAMTTTVAAFIALTTLTTSPVSATIYHLQEHMTPQGEQKCRAFRRVSRDARALQKAQDGALSVEAQRRLEGELHRARALAPSAITAPRCGVAL